MKKKTED